MIWGRELPDCSFHASDDDLDDMFDADAHTCTNTEIEIFAEQQAEI
jgi:hypothetical protein